MDFETAYRDAVTLPPWQWHELLSFVYGVKLGNHHKPKQIAEQKGEQEETKETDPEKLQQEAEERYASNKIGDAIAVKKFENLGIWVESNIYFKNFKRVNF